MPEQQYALLVLMVDLNRRRAVDMDAVLPHLGLHTYILHEELLNLAGDSCNRHNDNDSHPQVLVWHKAENMIIVTKLW